MAVKKIPNLLTGLRFGLTVLLLFLPFPGTPFFFLYLVCGLTDILDGWLARRRQASCFGSPPFPFCAWARRVLPESGSAALAACTPGPISSPACCCSFIRCHFRLPNLRLFCCLSVWLPRCLRRKNC